MKYESSIFNGLKVKAKVKVSVYAANAVLHVLYRFCIGQNAYISHGQPLMVSCLMLSSYMMSITKMHSASSVLSLHDTHYYKF